MPIDKHSAQLITSTVTQPTQSSAPGIWRLEDVNNSVAANRWPLAPNLLRRSLRINTPDSAYLNRTFTTASNRKLWTYSLWIKKNNIATTTTLLSARGSSDDDYAFYYWSSSGNLYFLQGRVGANDDIRTSVPIFRDPSAWYHMVIIYDSDNAVGADRIQAYVNGTKVAWSIGTGPMAQGFSSGWVNYNGAHEIGRKTNYQTDYTGNCMITEVNFIDGQSVAATNFAETDPQTGVWVPKIYTGTYGTNGFRLNFSNNSSTTTLGYDSSGLGNNWTPNNFSVASGSDNDSLLDTPSMYGVDTGLGGEVGGNYATLNPINNSSSSPTLTNGNLTIQGNTTSYQASPSSILFPATGKWYLECTLDTRAIAGQNQQFTIGDPVRSDSTSLANGYTIYALYTSLEYFHGTTAATPTNLGIASATGDIIKFAYDADTGKFWSGVNNTWFLSGNPAAGSNPIYTFGTIATRLFQAVVWGTSGKTSINFGQRPFAFPAPTGYKCLTTQNLSTPLGNVGATQANKYFNVVTYTGNGTAQTITGVGFQPDLVWTKLRNESPSSTWHRLIDSVRGGDRRLSSNDTQAETQSATLITSFNADGFSVGSDNGVNANGVNIVAWCWNAGGSTVTNTSGTITSSVRANRTAGFSVIRFTGSATNNTVGHGLGTAPAFIIVKAASESGQSWRCYHQSLGLNQFITLDTTAVSETLANYWGSSAFTTDVFGVYAGGGAGNNRTGQTMIAYCWAAIPGFSAFGSYTGNGSTDGPFVYTGFRPKWVLIKVSTGSPAADWVLHDTSRSPYNVSDIKLSPNTTAGDVTSSAVNVDILSSGFKIRNTDGAYNTSANTYIYAAFAETPFKNTRAR